MPKNSKTTLEKLEGLINIVAVNVAEIKSEMATKADIAVVRFEMVTKEDLTDLESRLSNKIDKVEEKIDLLEEVDIQGMQGRISALEDAKKIKQKHV